MRRLARHYWLLYVLLLPLWVAPIAYSWYVTYVVHWADALSPAQRWDLTESWELWCFGASFALYVATRYLGERRRKAQKTLTP